MAWLMCAKITARGTPERRLARIAWNHNDAFPWHGNAVTAGLNIGMALPAKMFADVVKAHVVWAIP